MFSSLFSVSDLLISYGLPLAGAVHRRRTSVSFSPPPDCDRMIIPHAVKRKSTLPGFPFGFPAQSAIVIVLKFPPDPETASAAPRERRETDASPRQGGGGSPSGFPLRQEGPFAHRTGTASPRSPGTAPVRGKPFSINCQRRKALERFDEEARESPCKDAVPEFPSRKDIPHKIPEREEQEDVEEKGGAEVVEMHRKDALQHAKEERTLLSHRAGTSTVRTDFCRLRKLCPGEQSIVAEGCKVDHGDRGGKGSPAPPVPLTETDRKGPRKDTGREDEEPDQIQMHC